MTGLAANKQDLTIGQPSRKSVQNERRKIMLA